MSLGRVDAIACGPNVAPGCEGHTSKDKFKDCITQALYAAPDADTGNVDGFGLWAGLIIQTEPVTLAGEWGPVHVPADTYRVIGEYNSGRILVARFTTAEDAQEAFDEIEDDYGAYLAGVDEREARITSSTGRIGR